VRKVLAIALNTFRETVRDKVLYTLLVFAFAMIGSAAILIRISVRAEVRILQDLGLTAISIIGVLMATFLGITLVYKEVDRRTIFTIISKPVHRYQFVLGKYLGLLTTLLVSVAAMALGLLTLSRALVGEWTWLLLPAVWLTYVELAVITALATLFSSFTTPVLSATFTLSLFLIGRLSGDLVAFLAMASGAAVRAFAVGTYYLLPNLRLFDARGSVALGQFPDPRAVVGGTAYGLLYGLFVLAATILIFQRRDFK
jgi:ABC-type transport system involved in multi-copper enzyme maturation permease subunit